MKEFIVDCMFIWVLIAIVPWVLIARLFTRNLFVLSASLAIQATGLVLQIISYILDK